MVGLFAFVWLELASPDPGSVSAIRLWLLAYVVITLTGAIVCGDKWFGRADPFEVYSVVASRFSPLRRSPQSGRIEIGNPFDHLPTLPIRPGTVTVLGVLLGLNGFRQLLGDAGVAQLRRPANRFRRNSNVDAHRGAACLHRRRRRDVLVRGPRHRRRRRQNAGNSCRD